MSLGGCSEFLPEWWTAMLVGTGSWGVAPDPRMVLLNGAFDRTESGRVSSCSSFGPSLPWVLGPDWGPASGLRQESEGPPLQGVLEPELLGPGDLLGLVLAWH